ncbi:ABC-type phosphate/phosphonate transport system, permease component [Clostridium carnis]|uniref:ABC-type phosphate/phosphonate transport system, permease component n=1 Tax=Clostridium carnis TaxID=1530 RepID=A0ABY6SZS2_9CLOT|nr:ABC transporter permease subunit [Clostridium carnis]VDG73711.1 ABC-type phosphate/phosphonate transport system, permease component [Clostridium carnis]
MIETYAKPLDFHIQKSISGKIKIKSKDPSQSYVKITLLSLLALTVLGFATFDYKGIDIIKALGETLVNIKTMFLEASLTHFTIYDAIKQVGITMSLSFLTTLIGGVIALFLSLFAAKNLSTLRASNIIKAIVVFIRAIPTVLWVLIFAVTVGLGSEAAVIGMVFHTVGYLIKAYSEAFEELDEGIIEALKASGASWWQIVFQAVLPSSMSYIIVWTFMRFEINFTNAVAMGAAAGAGGIGFELFMASNFYYNVREVGFIAISILVCAILLEIFSTKIKNKYLR